MGVQKREADPALVYSGLTHTSFTRALKSVVPAVKTVVPEVKPVVSTPVISSYTGLGAQFPLTYGSGLIHTPFARINTPYTAGMISPHSGLTRGIQYRMPYGVQY